jgi:glycosyltransferase involved in cell wall biosynthesis
MAYHMRTTFVRRDCELLRNAGLEVEEFVFHGKGTLRIIKSFFLQFFKLCTQRKEGVVWMTQSAGYLSLLPVLFSKWSSIRTLIVVIGTDGANLPEIDYGHFRRPGLAWATRQSLAWAQGIAPVHRSLEQSDYTYMPVRHTRQGFRTFVPNIRGEVREVVNGYSATLWGCDVPFAQRTGQFLTVFQASWARPAIRKGMDTLIEVAKLRPEWRFTLVGSVPQGAEIPDNITVVDNVEQNALRAIYNQHRVYIQASIFEGFPNALCEAMACGCFPVGSQVTGIPDIISTWGIVVAKKEPDRWVRALELAMQMTDAAERDAHSISRGLLSRFPLKMRQQQLVQLIECIVEGKHGKAVRELEPVEPKNCINLSAPSS